MIRQRTGLYLPDLDQQFSVSCFCSAIHCNNKVSGALLAICHFPVFFICSLTRHKDKQMINNPAIDRTSSTTAVIKRSHCIRKIHIIERFSLSQTFNSAKYKLHFTLFTSTHKNEVPLTTTIELTAILLSQYSIPILTKGLLLLYEICMKEGRGWGSSDPAPPKNAIRKSNYLINMAKF